MPGDTLHARVRLFRGGPDAFTLDAELVAPPGITVLFGPSGSGKSTLLSVMAGLTRPDAGFVRLGDQVWSDAATGHWTPPHQRGLAFVFQAPLLFPHLSVVANAEFGVSRDLPKAQRRNVALEMLDRMRVAHLAHRRPRSLSGGEAQRVALARAFAVLPRLVLLDEAFSALHQSMREELLGAVQAYVREAGLPMVYVTHQRNEARAVADRIVTLTDGKVERVGGVEVLSAMTGS